jgi:hypothetical protein
LRISVNISLAFPPLFRSRLSAAKRRTAKPPEITNIGVKLAVFKVSLPSSCDVNLRQRFARPEFHVGGAVSHLPPLDDPINLTPPQSMNTVLVR